MTWNIHRGTFLHYQLCYLMKPTSRKEVTVFLTLGNWWWRQSRTGSSFTYVYQNTNVIEPLYFDNNIMISWGWNDYSAFIQTPFFNNLCHVCTYSNMSNSYTLKMFMSKRSRILRIFIMAPNVVSAKFNMFLFWTYYYVQSLVTLF